MNPGFASGEMIEYHGNGDTSSLDDRCAAAYTGIDLDSPAPMVGGLATSFALELLVYPAICLLWKKRAVGREAGPSGPAHPPPKTRRVP